MFSEVLIIALTANGCYALRYQLQVFLHFEAMKLCGGMQVDASAMAERVSQRVLVHGIRVQE